ncbi:hypothetical protein [Delftia sp. DT-2]|uniref:hypothetical protein n=1 Tax=Delftia sp. DT-2 TaxID=3022772 RepID=UPI00233F5148|nr:hypothetical protein [Delftia sp. DT-2]MDC2858648.1 hypothetical protein [Delftia sp. DT-2]
MDLRLSRVVGMALAVCLDISEVAAEGREAAALGQIREAVVEAPVVLAMAAATGRAGRGAVVRASGVVVGATVALAMAALVVWASTVMAAGAGVEETRPPTVLDWVCLAAVVAAWKAALVGLVALVPQIVAVAAVAAVTTLLAVLGDRDL